MKIIDEKGRIFGRINLIDYFVILLVGFCFIPMLYFGWQVLTIKPKMAEERKQLEAQLEQKYEKKYKEKVKGISVFTEGQKEELKLNSWSGGYSEGYREGFKAGVEEKFGND